MTTEAALDKPFVQPAEPSAIAQRLGISHEAVELYLRSEIVDLHIDTFIWQRIFGYDMRKRHGQGLANFRYMGQVDLPRLREAAIGGGIWAITTNPLRSAKGRAEAFSKNLVELKRLLSSQPDVMVVRNLSEYQRARAQGKHAALLGIQGGNALDASIEDLEQRLIDDLIIQITLVHLYDNRLGGTSTPSLGKGGGLTDFGRDYVRVLNAKRVFVDLAHISRKAFFDAVEVHDRSQPLIVTHTGIGGVHKHWRNLDDEQIRAIADTGGTIGVIYQRDFLGPVGQDGAEAVARHIEHVIQVAGEDVVSLGSDWDGMITPPPDMPTCLELPRLVQHMLDRGFKPERILKVMGGNFLRSLGLLRA
jgi:membrane dipeptidase